jgi:hypothetical protein
VGGGKYIMFVVCGRGKRTTVRRGQRGNWHGHGGGGFCAEVGPLWRSAFRAEGRANPETLGGKPATAFVASDQLKDQVRSELSSQVSSGKVGGKTLNALISGTTPSPQALGEGPSSFVCNLASDCVAVTQSGSGIGLHATAGANLAVFGETASTTGRGVYGLATATTGATIGVWGGSYSTSGVGVSGGRRRRREPPRGCTGCRLVRAGLACTATRRRRRG